MKKLEDLKREIRNMIVCNDYNHPIECLIVKVDLITFEAEIVCSGLESDLRYSVYEYNDINSYAFVVKEFPDIHRQLDINFENISKLLK